MISFKTVIARSLSRGIDVHMYSMFLQFLSVQGGELFPDTDSSVEVNAQEVKRKQEVKRQAVLREKNEAEKKLKGRGRAVSSHLLDIWEQSNGKTEESEYQ